MQTEANHPANAHCSSTQAAITVSIVSHGHDAWLPALLQGLAATSDGRITHVVLTHNLAPEAEITAQAWPFVLTQVRNPSPLGFGTNHNHAFGRADTPLFCVLNPDISLTDPAIWARLTEAAADPSVGCAFPVLLNPDGSVQDNVRTAPTPLALFRRRVLRQRDETPDWVSAAFWLLPHTVFGQLGGFDERYFLYCEDTDFCLRLQLKGFRLNQAPTRALHDAQRHSHRSLRHLALHLRSLLRLWTSPVLRHYLASRRKTYRA